MHGFVASLGAVPVAIDPQAHDRLVALTSHLPHALANLLVNQAGSGRIEGHDPLAAAGGSLRDMTRVAGANPRIWVDIFLDNAPELREALAEHRRRVEQLEQALDGGDGGYLARWIAEASENRRRMLAEAYPDPGELQRVSVHVPDRPGVLAGITQALGAERINIEDFELRHFSPERGGVLTMLVSGEDEAARAAALLEAQGYGVSVSPVLENEDRAGVVASRAASRVPGDKSISHRAVLLGAIADGETRDHAVSAARATPSRRSPRCARSASGSTRTATRCASRGAGLRGLRAPAARSTAATRARSRGCSPGMLAGQRGQRFELTATSRSARGRWGGSPSRCARWAPAWRRRTAACRSGSRRGRCTPIRYELPVASAQVKSCVLLAGLYAADGPTAVRRAGADARPHRADAAAAGRERRSRAGRVEVWPAERLEPLSARRARRLLVRGAVPRRRDAAPGLAAAARAASA